MFPRLNIVLIFITAASCALLLATKYLGVLAGVNVWLAFALAIVAVANLWAVHVAGSAVKENRVGQVSHHNHAFSAKVVHPLTIMRVVALAHATIGVGSALAGFYTGLTTYFSFSANIAIARDAVIPSGIIVLAAVLAVAAGLWLEHVCRIPDEPDQTTPNF